MKKLFIFSLMALALIGCNTNPPELDEDSRQMLYGEWQLTKETITNGDGFGGVYTREGDDLWAIIIYEFAVNDVSRLVIPNYSSDTVGYFAPSSYKYNVKQQANGTWLLTIVGLFDKEPNLDGGCSPITIRKITKDNLEWEYESYGGDEGPVGYYQYFKRSISIAN